MARRDAGSGSIHQRSDGMWIATVELPTDPLTGKRRRRTISSKRRNAVVTKLRDLRRDLDRTGDLPTSSPRLADWLATWDQRHLATLKPRAAEAARSAIRNYIVPPIGKIRLDRLTAPDVHRMHDYVTGTKGLSSTTANQAHRVLRKAIADAERQGLVSRNVATLVDAPALAVMKREHLTADEARALLIHHREDAPLAMRLALALLTGMRQGECLGLTWDALDLDAGVITVSWQLQTLSYVHGCGEAPCGKPRAASCPARRFNHPAGHEIVHVRGALHMLRPKSRKGWRQVPMPPILADMFRAYNAEHYQPHERGLVFLRADGHPLPPRQDYQLWQHALATAGLPAVPLHSARHTTATLLHQLGVPDQVRMAILGHSSATVTAGYTHLADSEMMAAMGRLGDLVAPAMLEA